MLLKAGWSWTLPQYLRRIPGRWWWRRQPEEERPQKEEEDGEERLLEKEGEREENPLKKEREERSLKDEDGERASVEVEQKHGETPVRRLLHCLPWRRDMGVAPRDPEVEPAAEEEFQICFNLSRHLFDLCVTSLLGLCSPLFRLGLDIAGLRGPLRLWLHGLAAFLVTASGLHLLLCLLHSYLLHFACLYGLLQALVLSVSVRSRGWGIGGVPEEEDDEEDGEFALAPEVLPGVEEEEPR
ncbi:uncharacterized protein C6orf47 homolog [Microcaecilia unicolor]|uniref:Uncharacterized protein C6orf47 homolog n=1 Tax=Microcaecilia unicolor TaxID=1415580 RepID=A0A6P7XRA8_9AMPH|nr:uncharacterized protein C6orf47 homolog [Microcaecilia unicolor]